MQIRRIRLQNWGPYRGTTDVDLAVGPSAPVVLVYGENMRGKTSFLRAIKWCLYGELELQDGRTRLDHLRLVNTQELEEGPADYLVELELEHDGEVFTLTRSGTAHIDEFDDRRTTPVRATLRSSSGNAYPEQDIPEFIGQMLDKQIADFFLFDGEMLIRFDERLREDDQSKKSFIRMQVEKALGLPFLKNLIVDLGAVHASVSEELTKGNRADDRAKKLQRDVADVDAQLKIHLEDLKDLGARQEELRTDIEELDTVLKGVSEIKDAYFRREALIESRASIERNIKNLSEEAADFAESTWWFPMAAAITQDLESTLDKLSEADVREAASVELKFQLRDVQAQRHSAVCTHCGQNMPATAIEALEHREHELIASIDALPAAIDSGALHARILALRQFPGASGVENQLVQLSQSIGRERLELHRVGSAITELTEALADNNLDVRAKQMELDHARAELASASTKAAQAESQVSLLRQRRSGIVTELGKQHGTSPLLARRVDVYSEALKTAEESLNTFRQRMRERVQDQASEIFRALTTEPDFAGIRLNEDYSLAVLNSDGSSVDLISAGGNQVLTMAFIGALGAASSSEAPLVMDTPLGRLDLGHRGRILSWLSGLSTQTILFVQSGEFEPERDRALLGTSIGREITIKRDGAAEKSTIIQGAL